MSEPGRQRIFMTADAVGGVWQYATDLSAALCRRGHSVTLALLGPEPSPDQRRLAEGIERLTLVETGQELDWLCPGPEPVERAARALAGLARAGSFDLVHCNHPALAGAAMFDMPLVAVAHGCVATWWQAARSEPLDPSFHWHRDIMRRGLVAANATVAPSAAYAAIVQQVYRLPDCPQAVWNGRQPLAPGDAAGAEESPPLAAALTVGRLWDEVKGVALLDRVAGMIDLPFLAAGALVGPHGEAVSLSRLQYLGRLDEAELASLLAQRPIFVSAATFEPFGLAVLEAAQAGCPLVLSDIPTFRELWDGAAIFVDPAEASGFARAITQLASDPLRRSEQAAAAAARAARYTPEASAASMERIYRAVLGRQRAAA